jgi:Trypsin-co-occurring domain 1
MKALVKVPLEGGDAVLVEVDDRIEGVVRSARPGEAVEALNENFQAALTRLQPMAQALVIKFRSMTERPDEVGVEFGIKLTADAGLVIAHTSGEANFKVTLHWRRPQEV